MKNKQKTTMTRLHQGDIIRDVQSVEYYVEDEHNFELSRIEYPFVVVLTQDCDLESDHEYATDEPPENQDKILFYILVAPLYNAQHFRLGEHLSELDSMIMEPKNSGLFSTIKKNQNPRYHYLDFEGSIEIPASVIDFKHFFSVNSNYLRISKQSNLAYTLPTPYREDISQRFASFLARIGLPQRQIPPNP